MTRRLLALVGAAALVVAGCTGDDTGSGSTAATTTSAPPDPAGTQVVGEDATAGVSIDASADGRTVAVGWYHLDEQSGEEQTLVATSTDGGESFGEPVVVTEPATQDPQVAVLDDGTVLVGSLTYDVTMQVDPDDIRSWPGWMVLHRSTDAGRSFQQVADLRDLIGERVLTLTQPPTFAASGDGRTLVFAWQDRTPATVLGDDSPAPVEGTEAVPVWAAVSTDGGASFGTPYAVSGSLCGCCRVDAFVDGDRAGVAYRGLEPVDDTHDERDAEIAYAEGSSTFGPAVEIHDDQYVLALDGCPASGPGVDGRSGAVHAAWWTDREGSEGWWYAASPDGRTFAEPQPLPAPETITASVELALDGSNASWIAGLDWGEDGTDKELLVWHVPDGGAPVAVADARVPVASAEEAYDIAGLDDHALVVWIDDGAVKVRPLTA